MTTDEKLVQQTQQGKNEAFGQLFRKYKDRISLETGNPLFRDLDEKTAAEVCRKFRKNGIEIWSVHAPFGKEANLSAVKAEDRIKALKNHKDALRKVAAGDIKTIVIHPGVGSKDEEREEMASLAWYLF